MGRDGTRLAEQEKMRSGVEAGHGDVPKMDPVLGNLLVVVLPAKLCLALLAAGQWPHVMPLWPGVGWGNVVCAFNLDHGGGGGVVFFCFVEILQL